MRSNRPIFVLSFSLLVATTLLGCNQSVSTSSGDEAANSVATMNTNCPIMGGKVSADANTVEWNGQTIGFCCDGCDEEFLALSDEEKAEKLAAANAEFDSHSDHEGHGHADHDHS